MPSVQEKLVRLVTQKLELMGKGPSTVEREWGLPTDAIRNIVKRSGSKGSSIENAALVCAALDIPFHFGDVASALPTETEIEGSRFATVPRFDASAAAGNGAINLEHQVPIDHLAFSREWLAREGISPGSCALITASGDSMAPTIFDGDLIMLDRRRTSIRSGRVFVYNDPSGGTLVKRLEIVEGAAITARSDNTAKDYAPIHYLGQEMNQVSNGVLGEVIWSGHRWR